MFRVRFASAVCLGRSTSSSGPHSSCPLPVRRRSLSTVLSQIWQRMCYSIHWRFLCFASVRHQVNSMVFEEKSVLECAGKDGVSALYPCNSSTTSFASVESCFRILTCEVCRDQFNSRPRLRAHPREVTGSSQVNFALLFVFFCIFCVSAAWRCCRMVILPLQRSCSSHKPSWCKRCCYLHHCWMRQFCGQLRGFMLLSFPHALRWRRKWGCVSSAPSN